MKNPNILKDELNILKSDRSSILTEVRAAGDELKELYKQIGEAEGVLLELRTDRGKEEAKISEQQSEEQRLKKSLSSLKQDLNTVEAKLETAMIRAAQQEKQHLGRIKELKDEQEFHIRRVEELKENYDKNSNVINSSISERRAEERSLNARVVELKREVREAEEFIKKTREEEKKATKERLKKEDKIRSRERALEREEHALAKKQEDFSVMASDVVVVYYRLKELYAKVDPSVDFEKLVNKTI